MSNSAQNVYVTEQVRVLASDGGIPSLTDVTVVYLNVTRNRFSPSFVNRFYSQLIPESQSLGTEILRVTATDQDTAVRRYTL